MSKEEFTVIGDDRLYFVARKLTSTTWETVATSRDRRWAEIIAAKLNGIDVGVLTSYWDRLTISDKRTLCAKVVELVENEGEEIAYLCSEMMLEPLDGDKLYTDIVTRINHALEGE